MEIPTNIDKILIQSVDGSIYTGNVELAVQDGEDGRGFELVLYVNGVEPAERKKDCENCKRVALLERKLDLREEHIKAASRENVKLASKKVELQQELEKCRAYIEQLEKQLTIEQHVVATYRNDLAESYQDNNEDRQEIANLKTAIEVLMDIHTNAKFYADVAKSEKGEREELERIKK